MNSSGQGAPAEGLDLLWEKLKPLRDLGWQIPPAIFYEMQGEFVDYQEGQSLTLSFPILEKFYNPAGVIQGGMIATALDNTFGPLALIIAQGPCTSLDLNTTYLRPAGPAEEKLVVKVELVSQSKTFLTMNGTVASAAGKLIATATTRLMILTNR